MLSKEETTETHFPLMSNYPTQRRQIQIDKITLGPVSSIKFQWQVLRFFLSYEYPNDPMGNLLYWALINQGEIESN